ncbi:MAG: DNA-protecting protein DprA, partial [Marinirhabdus sp.]
QGCNNLIKMQKAHLLTGAADILYHLGWKLENEKPKPIQAQLFVELNAEEKKIYRYLKENDSAQMDRIALSCGLPTYKIAALLLNMELKGVVLPLPGKLFRLAQ